MCFLLTEKVLAISRKIVYDATFVMYVTRFTQPPQKIFAHFPQRTNLWKNLRTTDKIHVFSIADKFADIFDDTQTDRHYTDIIFYSGQIC